MKKSAIFAAEKTLEETVESSSLSSGTSFKKKVLS